MPHADPVSPTSFTKETVAEPIHWIRAGKRGAGRRIGIVTPNYGLEKLSYGLAPPHTDFIKVNRLPLHRFVRGHGPVHECPVLVGPHCDLIHTFNQLPVHRPFVVSFEAELPRFLGGPSARSLRFGLSLLSSPRCRAVLAMSEAALTLLRRLCHRLDVRYPAEKTRIFRGGVSVPSLCQTLNPAKRSGPIRCVFVGTDGIRKGVEAALGTVERLRDAGLDCALTVVGGLEAQSYPAPTLEIDRPALMRRLAALDWVTHYPRLPNARVLELLWSSHIHLFPTIDESLGWVTVEAGLCGTATASTDIFAIPELVRDGVDGWLAPIDKADDRRWRPIGTPEAADLWPATQVAIAEALAQTILRSDPSPARLTEMGARARTHLDGLYSVDQARARLDSIYADALQM